MENVKDILSRVLSQCRLEVAIVHKLDEHDAKIKVLDDDRKMKAGSIKALQKEVTDLRIVVNDLIKLVKV